MSEQSAEVLTLAEFLEWEESQPGRHELVGGRAYAMAGGDERHSILKDYLAEVMAPMARRHGCRPFGSDRRLVVPWGNAYYPDFMVCCGPPASSQYEDDAVLIVEVLSPSTRAIDRREKLQNYGTLTSLDTYVLAEPDLRRFQVVKWPDGAPVWTEVGPGDILSTPFGVVSLDAIYDVVDATTALGGHE